MPVVKVSNACSTEQATSIVLRTVRPVVGTLMLFSSSVVGAAAASAAALKSSRTSVQKLSK